MTTPAAAAPPPPRPLAPPRPPAPVASNGDGSRVGPHPGFISSSNQYTSEIRIRRMLKDNGCDPSREDNYRLQGVQLIDSVREYLGLYVYQSQRLSEYAVLTS